EFALDQKRELHETARMDVGAARERCPRAYQSCAFLAIRGPRPGLGVTKLKPRPSALGAAGVFLLDSSSQYLHVFILVPKSRFDLTIRMTSTSRPTRGSPVKSFIDSCD